MTRPEWVEAGARIVTDLRSSRSAWNAASPRYVAASVVAAVEPLIRADERTTLTTARYLQATRDAIEADLRAQIAAAIEAQHGDGCWGRDGMSESCTHEQDASIARGAS